MISSWTFFWLVGSEVIRSQHHQPSTFWFLLVCGYVLAGSMPLTSSTWWRLQYLQNSLKNMASDITCSPWDGTKGPWLFQVPKLLLLLLLLLFWLHEAACRILVPHQGWNPCPLQWKCSVMHWITREVPKLLLFCFAWLFSFFSAFTHFSD